jgi:DNA-binding NtrC family response regulator
MSLDILIIDDEPDVRRSLSNFLKKLGHATVCASDGLEGLKEFHIRSFNLVITDIRMPGIDGLEFLRRIKVIEKHPADVIVVTGHGDMDNAIKALKFGAFDYLQKPIDVRELAITIERSAEYSALRNQYMALKQELRARVETETRAVRGEAEHLRTAYLREIGLDGLCVYSDAMRGVIRQAEKYSTDRSIPVLIEGESGTGKELVARFIHLYGQAKAPLPFVAINCGAIFHDLIEGELFGHDPGAFTGATAKGRIGKIEAANGGTLFLDEIGDMPLNVQVKLLRVLEERRLYRLGGVREIPVDIRVISATNKDLRQEVIDKRFRLDLFYRINTGNIRIPPLRKRREDILPLALRFLDRSSARRGKRLGRFSPEGEAFLTGYDWPGNVRQLKNGMERLSLLHPLDRIDAADLGFIRDLNLGLEIPSDAGILAACSFGLPEERFDLEDFNRRIVRKALERHNHNQVRTARYLGISRRALQGRIKNLAGKNSTDPCR